MSVVSTTPSVPPTLLSAGRAERPCNVRSLRKLSVEVARIIVRLLPQRERAALQDGSAFQSYSPVICATLGLFSENRIIVDVRAPQRQVDHSWRNKVQPFEEPCNLIVGTKM